MTLLVCLSVSVYLKAAPAKLLLQGGSSEGTTSSAETQIISPELGIFSSPFTSLYRNGVFVCLVFALSPSLAKVKV